jgi:uncharacterized membrane protein
MNWDLLNEGFQWLILSMLMVFVGATIERRGKR